MREALQMVPDVNQVAARVRTSLGLARCRPLEMLGVQTGRSVVVKLDTDLGPVVATVTNDGGASRSAQALAALACVPPAVLFPLRVPRLLLHDECAGLIVVEHVPGRTVAAQLAAGDLAPMELAGRAIARLHAAPAIIGPRRGMSGHIADLMRPQPQALASAVPELAGRIESVLQQLHQAVAAVGAHPIHRDLHPRQLIVQADTVVLLGWDFAAHGDPAMDAGSLRAHLQHRQTAGEATAAIAAFEAGYAEAGNPTVLGRAHVYSALTRLRLALKGCRLGGRDAFPVVRRLLDEAADLLAVELANAR